MPESLESPVIIRVPFSYVAYRDFHKFPLMLSRHVLAKPSCSFGNRCPFVLWLLCLLSISCEPTDKIGTQCRKFLCCPPAFGFSFIQILSHLPIEGGAFVCTLSVSFTTSPR